MSDPVGVDMKDRLKAHEATRRSAWEAYEATERSAWEAHEATERPAWEALKCGDPLVDWIVDNAWDHAREALQVLAILPATLETLNALAMQNEWCGAWDDLRTAALIAGVIEEDES